MRKFKNMLDFSGKNIVVSGGLGLIGTAVCEAFLEFGGNVIVADIDENKFNSCAGWKENPKISFKYLDVSDVENIEQGIGEIIKSYETIDTWVNLAYPRTADWGAKIEEVSIESWNKNVNMHLGGYFIVSKLILEQMKKQQGGSLINFGSIYGVVGPNFDIYEGLDMTMPVAYSAIKGAIINLSRYLASLYGTYNVRVNTVCPGGVENGQDEKFIKKYNELNPLKRMALAEEIAVPTVFLASEGASYVNGHTLMVDGGWTAV